jgi:hypothetical protein
MTDCPYIERRRRSATLSKALLFTLFALIATLSVISGAEEKAAEESAPINPGRSTEAAQRSEASNSHREEKIPLRQLFYQTASDDWREREEASKALLQLGPEALEDLRAALRSTGDAEARKRIGAALARLEPVPVQGKFVIISNVTLRDGRPAGLSNENARGTITVEKGKVTFEQDYPGGRATQVYVLPEHAPQTVSGEFEIPIKWESIKTEDAYNPDSVKPRLIYSPTADGPRLVLRFTDTTGVEGIVTCRPADESDKSTDEPKAPLLEVED